ncbi:retrovirus-related pol polyprotein from transposon TNT 1-94 [Tanacetum coccineum]
MILNPYGICPLIWPSIEENRVTRPKKYSKLSATEAIQADCDVKATNIILQGLPRWSMHWLQSLSSPQFKMVVMSKKQILFSKDYHQRFSLLLNDMNIYNMKLEQFQVNTKFLNTLPPEWSKFVTYVKLVRDLHTTNIDQLHAYLGQHEFHANEKGDDPIDAINHMMSFLTAVVTYCYPTTNNQLRNSSNPRKQATINDGRVTLQPIQGRQTCFVVGTTRTYTPGASGSNSRKQMTVICYNYKGEGHMSKQCTKLKRKWYDSWFKDKVLLVQAQENGQILHEEELAFLADPRIAEDALAEVHNHDNMINQAMQAMSSFEKSNVVNHSETKITSDSNIIPYSQYVIETQQINLDNKSVNDTLTTKLERYKEQVKVLKEGQNFDLKSNDIASDSSAQSIKIDRLKQTLSEHLKEKESLMQIAVEQHRLESKTFEVKMNQVLNENERLLEQVINKDIVNIIMNSSVDNASVKEEAAILREIVEHGKSLNPLNESLDSAKPHKPKSEDTNEEKLYLLHMDLCGPMRVASVNGKKIDNGTEFVNQTLREYYEKVGISHETSVARSPHQNGVVERCNRTLIEAARTMLIYTKAPLFLWAEAVATACYTQNRSIIRLRHGKTPYELLHDKLPDLSFFHVFGALCYPTNDSENLRKLQPKADIGIFIGYAPTKKAFRIYNRRTRRIIKTIHVDFDELTAMASNKYVDHPTPEVIAPIAEVVALEPAASTGSPSSTIVDQDAPSPSNSQTTPETQSPIIPNDVEENNHDLDVAYMNNDPFFELGHTGEIKVLSDVNVNHMHQPWRSFAAIINKCLSGKTTALESLCLSRAQILWGMYHNMNVDYVYLLWEDLVYQVENKNSKKNNDMDDPMFTIIRVISKHQDTQIYGVILPQHLINQAMLESEAYKTYHNYAAGEKIPKPKYVKNKADPESSPKKKSVKASKGKRIKTSTKVTKPVKKKQPATTSKEKGLNVLSEVALSEAKQIKMATKRRLIQTHGSYTSGSGADKGTGVIPGVFDVPT